MTVHFNWIFVMEASRHSVWVTRPAVLAIESTAPFCHWKALPSGTKQRCNSSNIQSSNCCLRTAGLLLCAALISGLTLARPLPALYANPSPRPSLPVSPLYASIKIAEAMWYVLKYTMSNPLLFHVYLKNNLESDNSVKPFFLKHKIY